MLPTPTAPAPLRHPRNGALLAVLVAVGLGALLYLPFLGASDLTYPDEPDVAAPAREMLERGDLITPTHNGEPWIDYPPLVYWCAIGSARLLGGMTEGSLRLPVSLAAILLAALAAAFAARRLGSGAGVLTAVVLLTLPHYAYQATNVHPDMLFALGQGAGLMLYAAARRWSGPGAWVARATAFACFGVAILAKGPLGLLLPGLVLTVWHLSLGEVRRTLLLAPLSLVALAVAFPWYALLVRDNGLTWVWGEIVAQNFSRFGDALTRGHNRPWFYYFVRIWHCLGLWSLVLPFALFGRWRERLWGDPLRRLLWLWATLTFLFLTLAATKREVYLLSAYPAFALLIADALLLAGSARAPWLAWRPDAALRWLALVALLATGAATVLGAVGAFALPHLAWHVAGLQDLARPIVASLVPFAAAAAVAGALIGGLLLTGWRRDRPALLIAGVAALHGVGWLLLVSLAQPRFNALLSYKPHGLALNAQLPPGERLGFLSPGRENHRRAAFLYYAERRLSIVADADGLAAYLKGAPGRLAVVDAALAERLMATDPRFRGAERWRFEVTSNRWIVLGSP